ncbi:MAG: RNA polymerase sigma factor [Deltaproteobacteria bacterium]|nr:RNA polymerase sigma factor [Deltaproteobacteria bacterium]
MNDATVKTRTPAALSQVVAEDDLIERAQRGERAALEGLLCVHGETLLYRVILPRVGDQAVAEDIFKATMVSAIEKLQTFQLRGRSIYAWLRQIAVNKVVDHYRASGRRRKFADRLAHEPAFLPSGQASAEQTLIAQQEQQINRQRIEQTLERINPRYSKAIALRLIEELPRDVCAERLEVSPATFDVLFFRALRAFRKEFDDDE